MRRTATIDSSCLIALHIVGLLDELSVLFERIHVPRRVREEVSRKRNLRRRLNALLKNVSLYRRCDVAEPARVQLLLHERKRKKQPQRDRGEAEAVIQATEVNAAMVIVDDPLGREWANGHSVEPHGMIWVLRELKAFGAVKNLHPLIQRLRKSGYRLPKHEVRQLLDQFGED